MGSFEDFLEKDMVVWWIDSDGWIDEMLDDEMLDDKMLDLDDLYICFYVLYSTQLEAEANIPELKKKKTSA